MPVILHALEQQSSFVLHKSPCIRQVGGLWKHRAVSHSHRPLGASLQATALILFQQMPCHDTVFGIEVWQHHAVSDPPIFLGPASVVVNPHRGNVGGCG